MIDKDCDKVLDTRQPSRKQKIMDWINMSTRGVFPFIWKVYGETPLPGKTTVSRFNTFKQFSAGSHYITACSIWSLPIRNHSQNLHHPFWHQRNCSRPCINQGSGPRWSFPHHRLGSLCCCGMYPLPSKLYS
jgi:hypothetical protein